MKNPDDEAEYEKTAARDYARRFSYMGYGPALHIIVITLRCNHKCQYCHAAVAPMTAEGKDMDMETAKKVIDAIFFTTHPTVTIEFQGGEPLVNWEVLKFCVEYAEEKARRVKKPALFSIVTNLSLMTDEKLKYLMEHKFSINSSLDGTKIVHNFNRVYKDGNSFDLATFWIKKINHLISQNHLGSRDVMGRSMGAMVTVTRKTLEHWKDCVDTYVDLGMKEIFWRPLNPYGFGEVSFAELGYDTDTFIESHRKVLDYVIELNLKGVKMRESYAAIFLKKLFNREDPNFVDTRSPCGAVIGQVAYNYDGKIYTCDEGRMMGRMGDDLFLVTEVKDDGRETYKSMMLSPTTKNMAAVSVIDGAPGFEDHPYKPYLGSCPIHNYKHNGSLYPNFSTNPKTKIETAIIDYILDRSRDPQIREIFYSWINKKV